MPGRRKLKGQFFMLGAIALAVLFFAGLPQAGLSGTSGTSDMTILAENMETEFPVAVNLIILDGDDPARMGEFMGFVRDTAESRYMSMEMLGLVAVPDPGNPGDVTVHVANWMGTSLDVDVDLDGDLQEISLDDEDTGTLSYSGVSQSYGVTVSWAGRTWSETVPRDKTNLYGFLALSRGGNSIVKDIAG